MDKNVCIVTAWLLLDSAQAINRTYSGLVEALTQIGEHHSREGYDAERGSCLSRILQAGGGR